MPASTPAPEAPAGVELHPEEPAAGPWRVVPLVDVVDRCVTPRPTGRPAVIAVDGRSANGKTTLAGRIAGAVPGTVVVHTDDVGWHHSMFAWTDLLIDGILRPVWRGEAVSYRPPAWVERSRPGSISVPAGAQLVVVEGVGSSRRELTSWLDGSIWVQSDLQEALRRDQARIAAGETSAGFYEGWMAEEVPFHADQQPWTRAAVIAAGTTDVAHDPATEAVIAEPSPSE